MDVSTDVVAIDIGIRHFAKARVKDGKLVDFELTEIPERTIVGKCREVQQLLKDISPDTHVVVERQVPKNTVAMGLMYSVVSFALAITPHVSVIPATNKFWHDCLMCPKNYHDRKRLSVNHVLHNYVPDHLKPKFNSYAKQDDIADAVWMACVYDGT